MQTVSNRTFGVEIEMLVADVRTLEAALNAAGIATQHEGYTHRTTRHWKLVSDISVTGDGGKRGIELVSPPLSGQAGIDAIRTVCRVLAECGAQVNKTCGLHVHHDARDLQMNDWKVLVKKYITNEGLIDAFMPESRRGDRNNYCRSLRSRFADVAAAYKAINAAKTLDKLMNVATGGCRYHKINLTSYARHGTVEFRQHSGTVDADKIVAWIVFTQSMVEDAKTVTWMKKIRAIDSMTGLMKVVPEEQREEVRAFYAGRKTALAA